MSPTGLRHTWPNGTWTRDGFFPHASIVFDGGIIDAPVRVIVEDTGRLPLPHYAGPGNVWCALPGGGSIAVAITGTEPLP